jgi:hypothetical protein
MQGFPETWKLFQGFLQGKGIEKGCSRSKHYPMADLDEQTELGFHKMHAICWLGERLSASQ